MKTFQTKPLKPRVNTGLKTPNPEGFLITLKTRQDKLVTVSWFRGGPPLNQNNTSMTLPFKGRAHFMDKQNLKNLHSSYSI